jgi:DNA primase
VLAWAEQAFRRALGKFESALAYLRGRGLSAASIEQFHLGYAPQERGWLLTEARKQGFPTKLLEQAGLVAQSEEFSEQIHERFRGRLIFPIHDERGRPIGFGGRILPEVERAMAAQGKNVAKYLNSPETALFQKRKVLYAADLARAAAREAGWVAVVEGYTDVIAAHQVGLGNVVGTLGTALGDDHVHGLRRLAELVVLVFDGDDAGQSAAERALEFFLGHELDVRILSLPANLDPCDFLLKEGAEPFRELVKQSVDPLAFVLERGRSRFDFDSIEDSRKAAEWVLGILSQIKVGRGFGSGDMKLEKAVDSLSSKLRLPVEPLRRRLRELSRAASKRQLASGRTAATSNPGAPGLSSDDSTAGIAPVVPFRPSDLDPLDRELIEIVLNEPGAVPSLVTRVTASSLRDAPLRAILQACYDLHAEGQGASAPGVMDRLDDPQARALAAGLVLPIDPVPLPEEVRPAPWQDRLKGVLASLAERQRRNRLRDLGRALAETDETANPDAHRALQLEYLRLMTQRPDTKKDAS